MTSKPFSDDIYAEWSAASERECGPAIKIECVPADTTLREGVEVPTGLTSERAIRAEQAYADERVVFEATGKRPWELYNLDRSDAALPEWHAFKGMTPAGKVELVSSLLNPVDDEGNALPPMISKADALRLLDFPDIDECDRAQWLASLKPGDKVKMCSGDGTDALMLDPSVRGVDAIYRYQGKCEHIDACRVTWDGSHGFTRDGYCHESQLVKP